MLKKVNFEMENDMILMRGIFLDDNERIVNYLNIYFIEIMI
jgi:hypothetical protein